MMDNLKLDGPWCFAHLPRTVYLVDFFKTLTVEIYSPTVETIIKTTARERVRQFGLMVLDILAAFFLIFPLSLLSSFEAAIWTFFDRKKVLERSRLKFFESGSIWYHAATNNIERKK